MGLVSPSQNNAGETIEASDINNPVNQLAAVINGNIDATNIADNSITAAKVAANLPTSKLQNPYKFSVYRSTAFSTTATAPIQFDTKTYDTGSNVDIITNKGRFTAPAAGFYRFNATITMSYGGAGNIFSIALYKNGTMVKQGTQVLSTASQTIAGHVYGELQLAANDYIEVYNLGAATGVTTGLAYTFFDGSMISTT